jgi:hypothetical protein
MKAACATRCASLSGEGSGTETGLPATGQLDIDLGEEFRIEKRAVLHAVRIVDAVA